MAMSFIGYRQEDDTEKDVKSHTFHPSFESLVKAAALSTVSGSRLC